MKVIGTLDLVQCKETSVEEVLITSIFPSAELRMTSTMISGFQLNASPLSIPGDKMFLSIWKSKVPSIKYCWNI